MKKEHEIKLLETEKSSNLIKSKTDGELFFLNAPHINHGGEFINQLLLVLSDEEIKKGDLIYGQQTHSFDKRFIIGIAIRNWKNNDWSLENDLDIDLMISGCKKIIASNSQELTPNALLPDSYIETLAKAFNNGKAPEMIELEMDEETIWGGHLTALDATEGIEDIQIKVLKTSNNYVIVAEQEEKKNIISIARPIKFGCLAEQEEKEFKREDLIAIGFKEIPHMTILNSLIYDIGRHRQLSIGSFGTPNEVLFICEVDEKEKTEINDMVCIHNYDYDGYLTLQKVETILSIFKPKP